MTINLRRKMRTPINPDGLTNDAYIFFKWDGTISNGWAKDRTESETLAFWNQHRKAIMTRYLEEMRLKKDYSGKRPSFFWDEIKERRKKTGKEAYFKPWTKDGVDMKEYFEPIYESDYRFLKRLGKLADWEAGL